jgi:hypothetical protein
LSLGWNISSTTALRPVFGPWAPQASSSTSHYLLLQPSSSESGAGWLHPSVGHQQIKKKQSSPATRHGGAWGGGRKYSSYSFLTSALDGVSGQHHAPAALCPGDRTPRTHCTGGWVGLRAGLVTEVRRKILCPCRGSNPDRPVPVHSQTLYWLSYPGSVWHLPIYFMVSPLAFLLQNSFLVPSLWYDVVPFLQRGQPTLISLNVFMLRGPNLCTFYICHHCGLEYLLSWLKFLVVFFSQFRRMSWYYLEVVAPACSQMFKPRASELVIIIVMSFDGMKISGTLK